MGQSCGRGQAADWLLLCGSSFPDAFLQLGHRNSLSLYFFNRMVKKQPPYPENRDFHTSSTDNNIQAYKAVANAYHAGTQPAVFLTHSFLQDNPILLEEGCLLVNWDRIPRLYSWTDQMLTVSITDAQWDKWRWPGGWTMWEPDTRPEHFRPNLALVLCKGIFDDATDPGLMGKVCHYMTIAWVPDCIELLPFNQVWEAFNQYNEANTGVGLVCLHQSNEIFPDIYFQYYGEHFMIMGLSDPEIQFGTADEFVGGYLVSRHVAVSDWKAHAMLPLVIYWGPPIQLPLPCTRTTLVVPDFWRNIRPSMLSSWR